MPCPIDIPKDKPAGFCKRWKIALDLRVTSLSLRRPAAVETPAGKSPRDKLPSIAVDRRGGGIVYDGRATSVTADGGSTSDAVRSAKCLR